MENKTNRQLVAEVLPNLPFDGWSWEITSEETDYFGGMGNFLYLWLDEDENLCYREQLGDMFIAVYLHELQAQATKMLQSALISGYNPTNRLTGDFRGKY